MKEVLDYFWTAPEMLRNFSMQPNIVADIYSFGVVASEILTRNQPFDHLNKSSEGKNFENEINFASDYENFGNFRNSFSTPQSIIKSDYQTTFDDKRLQQQTWTSCNDSRLLVGKTGSTANYQFHPKSNKRSDRKVIMIKFSIIIKFENQLFQPKIFESFLIILSE